MINKEAEAKGFSVLNPSPIALHRFLPSFCPNVGLVRHPGCVCYLGTNSFYPRVIDASVD